MEVAMKKCPTVTEDALAYLPCSSPLTVEKGQSVYGGAEGSVGLYVVLHGRVKVWRAGSGGAPLILGIYSKEQIFGETSLIGGGEGEFATALERTQLMTWTVAAIEDQIAREPRLGIALMQTVAERGMNLKKRIRNIAAEKTPARVALALLDLVDGGERATDGAMCVGAMTHQCISEIVGTSREIVTAEMSRLRRLGLVTYSRKGIQVYTEALRDHVATAARLPQPPRRKRVGAVG